MHFFAFFAYIYHLLCRILLSLTLWWLFRESPGSHTVHYSVLSGLQNAWKRHLKRGIQCLCFKEAWFSGIILSSQLVPSGTYRDYRKASNLLLIHFVFFPNKNIKARTKWPPFYRRQFQMLFLDETYCVWLTHWPLGDLKIFFKMSFSNSYPESITWAIPAKLLSEVCHRTPLMISQHWFR